MHHEQIILDSDSQVDFFCPGGSCYVPGNGQARRNLQRLLRWARAENVPVISTLLRVRPDETGPLADVPHCIDGRPGERKTPHTTLPRRIDFGLRNSTDLPPHVLDTYQQVVFEMRHADIFRQARAERLLTELQAGTFILCGAGLSTGIFKAAIGLRSRGFAVRVARDAVADIPGEDVTRAILHMQAKGVLLTSTHQIIHPRPKPTQPHPPLRRSNHQPV